MSDTESENIMNGIDRDKYGGPVNTDVSYFRGSGAIVRYNVISGLTCHQCSSGNVYQPMQLMDMPMYLRCLKCGVTAPSQDFNSIETTNL